MKQNITLSLDKELIQKAKLLAAHEQTSISGMLSNELNRIIQKDEAYETARRRAINTLRSGFHLGGQGIASREALHER